MALHEVDAGRLPAQDADQRTGQLGLRGRHRAYLQLAVHEDHRAIAGHAVTLGQLGAPVGIDEL